jgi:predicted ArsR family transcriptional regulator
LRARSGAPQPGLAIASRRLTPNPVPSDQDAARHRALSDTRRVALLGVLKASSGALDAHALADSVGLHVNTVRWHLRILTEAGLVVEETTPSRARGRPRHTYRVTDEALSGDLGRFGLLAEVLVDALAHRGPDVTGTLEEAGRVRGQSLVRRRFGDDRGVTPGDALRTVVRLLEGLGFEPRLEQTETGGQIAMRPCPFGEMGARHSSIVCPVHLGLMRGTLEALDASIEATALEPFAKPDRCIAHFRTRLTVPA